MPLQITARAGLVVFSIIALAPIAAAQDVTVGDLVWFSSAPRPEQMPKADRLRPDFPEEMRKTDEIGYVLVRRHLDAAGKSLDLSASGTHMPLQRAVEAEFPSWSVSSAKTGGKKVDTRIWLPVIFNPKSAAANGPDATPRLLAAAPAFSLVRPARQDEPQVVRMKLKLDATGAIVSAEPAQKINSKLKEPIDEALKQWRFAPARRGGQPVGAEIVVPVLCSAASTDVLTTKPPRSLDQVPPIYPFAMRRYGINGKVEIDFIVDADGQVKNPTIYQSDNPAFDEPALTALQQWKFAPGTRDGKPVAAHMRAPIHFSVSDGGDAFKIDLGDQSKLPPELRCDQAPRIRSVALPIYPYPLRRDGVHGKAKSTMLIDERGRIIGVKTLTADRPEFGRALAAALENFRFDSAYRDGKPVKHILTFEQEFSPYDLPDGAGDDVLAIEKKHPDRIVAANRLDGPLKPVSRRPAQFPVTLGAGTTEGEAVVECLIDQKGRVRLPRIQSATDEAFGYAAVQAASAWWFEPPLSAGKPVIVRVLLPFKFSVRTPAGKPASSPKNTPAP